MESYAVYLHSRRIPKASVAVIIIPQAAIQHCTDFRTSEKSTEALDGIYLNFFLSLVFGSVNWNG